MSLQIYSPSEEKPELSAVQLRDELCKAALKCAELSTQVRREAGRVVCLVKCLRKLSGILSAQPPTSLTYFAGQELLAALREANEVLKLCEGIG